MVGWNYGLAAFLNDNSGYSMIGSAGRKMSILENQLGVSCHRPGRNKG